jgi:RNA polymerase sigma factor (TIGR02999 family)
VAEEIRVTKILRDLDLSDAAQADELLRLVYAELRSLAARQLRSERAGHTLQPTALVHEAYVRLARGPALEWQSRAHFFRIAARAMRQVLVDAARRRSAARRGGGWRRVTLSAEMVSEEPAEHDVLDLHEALERLGRLDSSLEQLIELRFFSGLTLDETADTLGVSRRKAAKDWAAARLWLRRELSAT